MTKQSFIKGALILLAAGVITRLLGFVPRIALPRIIGAEGVGLYQLSYPFLIVMLTLITGGIPLAVAKWTAEAISQGQPNRVKLVFRSAMVITLTLALGLSSLMFAFAPWITTHVLPDARVYPAFLVMTPMLLILAVSAVYRGYFQGKQNMLPTALSQLVETLLRILCVIVFAKLMVPYGLEWGAAGAMLGGVVGELGGLVVLLIHYRIERKQEKMSARQEASPPLPVWRHLLTVSVPVTLSKLVGSLSYLLESILIARSLAVAGIATGVATAQYGALQGMIIPIVLLPTALTYSLSVSLVPSLSEAAARGDKATIHKRLHQSMRLSLVAGAPFAVALWMLAEPICRIVFHHPEIAPMLQLMAPVALFIYLQGPLQAALQALEQPGTALLNTFIGAAVKLILIVQLATRPELGIHGALLAIGIHIVLVTVLHAIGVKRSTGFRMKAADFFKVGAAMLVMAAVIKAANALFSFQLESVELLLAFSAGIFVYLVLMIMLKIVERQDISRIPLIGRWF